MIRLILSSEGDAVAADVEVAVLRATPVAPVYLHGILAEAAADGTVARVVWRPCVRLAKCVFLRTATTPPTNIIITVFVAAVKLGVNSNTFLTFVAFSQSQVVCLQRQGMARCLTSAFEEIKVLNWRIESNNLRLGNRLIEL